MSANFCRCLLIFLSMLLGGTAASQDQRETDKDRDSASMVSVHPGRIKWVAAAHVAGYAGSLTGLSIMWYSKQPRSSFHFFDDNGEWLQIDKAGHFYSAYELSRTSHALWRWAGVPRKKAIWIGGLSGLAFQSIVEVMDGFSSEYGFSVGDYISNIAGSALFVSQQLTWDEQKVKLKFSSFPRAYRSFDLQQRAGDLYGSSLPERILKDYNRQNYWLSADVRSLFNAKQWPGWLNVAVGYGAEDMFGGRSNVARDKEGNINFDRSDLPRYRQWFLSPDLNFSSIKTGKKGVKVLFFLLDALKFPAPALELSQGKLKGHWIYF